MAQVNQTTSNSEALRDQAQFNTLQARSLKAERAERRRTVEKYIDNNNRQKGDPKFAYTNRYSK